MNKYIKMSAVGLAVLSGISNLATADNHGHDAVYNAVHNNDQRKATDSKRDKWRHPEAVIRFFEIDAGKTVVEVNPGGQWYSRILGPLLKEKGHYIGLEHNPTSYASSKSYAARLAKYPEKMAGQTKLFGEKASAGHLLASPSVAKTNSVDTVMVVRAMHNWKRRNFMETGLADAYRMLKPGGVLGVVQHRGMEDSTLPREESVKKGRWKQSALIAQITAIGFEFVEASEMNANPKDMKSYEKGVWTLPPVLRNGDVDRAKYEAIGESDRMTLKFRKPK